MIVPAGAFTSDQQISIQEISNNCPGSHGVAYRILPEGVTFAKPVTLQFRFNMTDSVKMEPSLMTAAYQNKQGVWMAMPGAEINAEGRYFTVNTTHFSDWTVVSGVKMTANPGIVSPGGKTRMVVYYAEDLLAPLVKEEFPIPGFIEMPASDVRNWRVTNGLGSIQPDGGKATYTAPAYQPTEAKATATISCEAETSNGNWVTLQATVTTVNGYISFRVNDAGSEIVHSGVVQKYRYNMGEGQAGDLYYAIYGNATGSTSSAPIWIEWTGKPGVSPLKATFPERVIIHFWYGNRHYHCVYLTNQGSTELLTSPGYVKINTDHTYDGYYTGEFEVEKASLSANAGEAWKTIKIKGHFRVPTRVDPVQPIPF